MNVTHASRPSTPVACLAIALIAGACAGTDAVGGAMMRDSAGITIVDNDYARPVWTEATAWRLSDQPVTRIGTVEGRPEQQLYEAFSSHRLRDGRIAVVNTSSKEVRIYGTDGKWLSSIGRDGEGPGEFRAAWRVHELPGDSLLVIDLYRHISIFDAEHEFARRFLPERIDTIPMGEGFEPAGQFRDGSLLFRSHVRGGERILEQGLSRNLINLVRIGSDGGIRSVHGPFSDQSSLTENGERYVFGPRAMTAPADSTFWYGPGNVFEIREIDVRDGRMVRLIRLDRPADEVTQPVIDEYIESIARQNPASRQIINRIYREAVFATHFPAHDAIIVDAADNLWVQDYRPYSDRVERTWSVFDPDGRYLGDVRTPAGLTVQQIGEDFVLGRWLDELEVEYILLYEIVKGGE